VFDLKEDLLDSWLMLDWEVDCPVGMNLLFLNCCKLDLSLSLIEESLSSSGFFLNVTSEICLR
jgi:hypothetical protein